MKQKILIAIFVVITSVGFSQHQIIGMNYSYSHFQLKLKKDTIDFIIADTNLHTKKPLMLFCQGSLPVPLFIKYNDQDIFPTSLSNFDLAEMNKNYHVVVISMPKTPVIVGLDHLNQAYHFVRDTAQPFSYDPTFLQADYLGNYVDRATKVLQFLKKQKWIDPTQLVVAGHSQGSHIALEIAAQNKKVTQLGLFAFNPLGRIDQYLRMARKQAEAGQISWEEADSLQNNALNDYASYFDPVKANLIPDAKTWVSFSLSQLNTIVNLKTPVYIAYGSNDINGDFCDLLPLYFIERHKSNYKVIRYPNVEHNFFPRMENGFISWTKNTANSK
jgi:dienelactone hydrolase